MPKKEFRVCQVCAVEFTLDKFLQPLIQGMKSKGWKVVSVCSKGPNFDHLRASGVEIENIEISRSSNPFLAIISTYHLYRFFRAMQFDVVHVHTPVASFVARLAAFLANVPLIVYTAHGFYFHENMGHIKYYFHVCVEKLFGLITDVLFTQSVEDYKSAIKFGFVSKDKCHVIGNGVDPSKFNPGSPSSRARSRSSLGLQSDDFVVGFVGRFVEEKGVNELLEAIIKVHSEYSNIQFLMIGGRLSSDHAGVVERGIESAKRALGKNFIDLGFREDTHQLYRAMDLFCLPSWREGLPRTIIEAMMSSKPVLATNIRGAREQVLDGQTGYLVPVKSAEMIANRIVQFMNDRSLGPRMGKAGFERAMAQFVEKDVVNKQIEIIDNWRVKVLDV